MHVLKGGKFREGMPSETVCQAIRRIKALELQALAFLNMGYKPWELIVVQYDDGQMQMIPGDECASQH